MPRNLLLYRFIIFNALLVAWLVITDVYSGWFRNLFIGDKSYITIVIAGLFFYAFAHLIVYVWKYRHGKWNVYKIPYEESFAVHRVDYIHRCAGWMAAIGMLGTIWGFITGLNGLDLGDFESIKGILKVLLNLIDGLHVAFYTTMIGGILGLWTEMNALMIRTAVRRAHEEFDQ